VRPTLSPESTLRRHHHGPVEWALDVTTLHFEAENEDSLRKVGMSKERRVDPQVQVGLLVDRSGFPLEATPRSTRCCRRGSRPRTGVAGRRPRPEGVAEAVRAARRMCGIEPGPPLVLAAAVAEQVLVIHPAGRCPRT
jgi:hypothetical protein